MNKGVVTAILPDEEMPKDIKGKPFEVIANPLGIISRKNPGQLIELYTGNIIKHVDKLIKKHIANGAKKEAIQELIRMNELLLDKESFKNIEKKIKSADQDKVIEYLSKNNVILVVDPMKSIKIENIRRAFAYYGIPEKIKVYDPSIGRKTKLPVSYGYIYWGKTKHISSKKIHARSLGPRSATTMQGLSGSKREGAQRIGELDTYALFGYNVIDYLKEVSTILSDDIKVKNKAINSIIQNGNVSLSDLKTTI